MIRGVVTLLRRAFGAVLLLVLLLGGAEVAVRVVEVRNQQSISVRKPSPLEAIAVPSWTARQELRPLASVRVKTAADRPSHAVVINSYGLRGEEIEVPKPPAVYRVLCLGDESVLGLRLPLEDLIGSHLEQQLQEATRLSVEVCHAGVPEACPLTEFLLLKHRLAALQPDLVLVAVNDGDVADDLAHRRYARFDAQGVPLACRHSSLTRAARSDPLTSWRRQFRLVDLGLEWAGDRWKRETESDAEFDAHRSQMGAAASPADRQAMKRCLEPLVPLANWCRQNYTALCVFHATDGDAGPGISAESVSHFSEALQELSASQQFLLVESPRMTTDTEWSAAENRKFAAQIAQRLVTEIAGPWSSPYFRPDGPGVTPASYNASPKRR